MELDGVVTFGVRSGEWRVELVRVVALGMWRVESAGCRVRRV